MIGPISIPFYDGSKK